MWGNMGDWGGMGIGMSLSWILLIVVIVVLVKAVWGGGAADTEHRQERTALDILNERYARGEIIEFRINNCQRHDG